MALTLDGKAAIGAGGSTKIGHGVAAALRRVGAKVVIADVDDRGAQEAVAADNQVTYVKTDNDAIANCVSTTLGAFGSADILSTWPARTTTAPPPPEHNDTRRWTSTW